MKNINRTFKPALLVVCLILSGFGVQAFGQDRPINSRIFPPYRFGDQRSVSNQQRIRAHMVQMIDSYISQDSEYEYSKHWALGDPAKLYGYFPAPSDPPGEYEIFILDGTAQRRNFFIVPVPGNWTNMDGSQFCQGGVRSGWDIMSDMNGEVRAVNDFVILRARFNNNNTWWHEAQHAAFFHWGDTLGVHILANPNDPNHDAHHSYIEYYAEHAIEAMAPLKQMEEEIEKVNRNPPKNPAEEQNAWGPVYQRWRSYVQKWEANVIVPTTQLERDEYFNLAGVRFPTPEEMAKVYLQGFYKRKVGIKPPEWVFSVLLSERTFIWTEEPADQGMIPETSYLLFEIKSSKGRTNQNNRPGTGVITVALEEASPKATFAIEVEDDGNYTAIGRRTTSNGEEWSFDLAGDKSSVKSKYFRLALTVFKSQPITAKEMHANISYGGFSPPAFNPQATYSPCKLRCTIPLSPQKASLKVDGHVLIKQSDTAELEAYVVDANGKKIDIDPKLSPRYIWSFFKKDDLKGNPVLFTPRQVEDLTIGVKILITQDGIEKLFLEGSHPMKVVSDTAPPANTPPPKPAANTPAPGTPPPANPPAGNAGSVSSASSGGSVSGIAEWGQFHLSYTISGANLEPRETVTLTGGVDKYHYSGKLAGGTLTISGKGWGDVPVSDPNYPWIVSASVSVDGNTKQFEYKAVTPGEKLNQSFSLSVPIPANASSGSFRMEVLYHSAYRVQGDAVTGTLKRGGGAVSAPPVPLKVDIAIDKPTIAPGEKAALKATATGGTAPYTYAWAGAASGTSAQLAFTAGKTGTQAFTVTVKDSKGATATASATITTEGPTVTLQRTSSGPVVLGLPYSFQAQLSAAGKPLPGAFVYRWEPHPAVTYSPHEGASTQTTAVFTRPGPTLVWVDVLRQEGPVLVTVAESEQIEIDVVSPELSLAANPSAPFTGQEVRINVTMNPPIQDKYVTFWWEIQGNALNAGPVVVGDAYSRAYTYKPKDTAPVTVTVHSKSKDGGDDLGQKSIAVTAKLYQVKISEPRLMGPPPRVWSEQAKGLVEVPRGIGTFQEFFVNASISPPPPDSPLRYDWKSQPEGCSIYSPGSQETRSSASQAGTFNISVTIRDSQNIVLGSGARTVSIVAPAPEPKKAEPPSKAAEALAKLKEASALAADGKLDEAIAVTEQAAAMDPNSKPISSYLQQLKTTKAQQLNPQKQNNPISPSPTAPPKSKTDAAAPSKADEAAAKIKQAGVLFEQNKIAEALALSEEALRLDPKNQDASRYVQTCRDILLADQKLKQARDLNLQSKTDEALALAEEALRLDPDSKLAVTYIRLLQASKHNKQAVSLAKAGRLEEASAEIAEAKKLAPSEANILQNEQWIQGLIKQRDANKAIAEKNKAEAASLQAANQAADQAKKAAQAKLQAAIQEAAQHLDKAQILINDGRLNEADAEIAAAKKVYPSHWKIPEVERSIAQLRQQQTAANAAAQTKIAEQANQQAAIQAATQHLDKALSLGKADRINEAAAEVAAAKATYPSHSKIPEFEQWIGQLRKQQDAASAAAAAKKAEAARQEVDREQAKRDAAKTQETQRAAEAERARQAEEQRRREEAQAKSNTSWTAELTGTSWQGEITMTNPEGERMTWPLAITIQNDNSISGQLTFVIPGDPESQKIECNGTYAPGNGNFNLRFSTSGEGANLQGKLAGAAKSSNSAEGTITVNVSGFGEGEIKGTWRISRK